MSLREKKVKSDPRRSVIGIPVSLSLHDRYYNMSKDIERQRLLDKTIRCPRLNEMAMEEIENLLERIDAEFKDFS